MILEIILLVLIYMSLFFIVATIKKDNSIVDIAWGGGFMLIAIYTYLQSTQTVIQTLLSLAILMWGIRLSIHIYLRNKGKGEDFRYKAWREQWKYVLLRSFFQVFMLQGAIMLVVSLPITVTNSATNPQLSELAIIGFLVFLIGLCIESLADYQLGKFVKTKKKGEIMTKGIWKYSRHPNYFGEVLLWWGLGITAATISPLALIGPVTITYFIVFVSGIPMLEKKYEQNKAYQTYKKRTSAFVPLPPRK